MPAANRTRRVIYALLFSWVIVLPAVFSVPANANDRQAARQAQKAAQRAAQLNQQRASRFKGITVRSRPTQQQPTSSGDDERGGVDPSPASVGTSSGGEEVVISDPVNGRRTIRMTDAMLARLGVASSKTQKRPNGQQQRKRTLHGISDPPQQDHPAETVPEAESSGSKALMTNIAGPGHLPSAPYRKETGEEMLDWAWGQYLDSVRLLEATYGSVDLEWIVLRNPLGQTQPGFWTPAFSLEDAMADDRLWLKELIAMYKNEGLKVMLFGNQPHRINLGTMENPEIWELTEENRENFARVQAERLSAIAHHLGADAIGFDSFPKAARTTDGVFGDVHWALGPELGIPFLQDLVHRLEDAGITTWAENQPPAGTDYSEWPESMHFAKLGGTRPRGFDDDDPDRPEDDPRDRRTPGEFETLFESHSVPYNRGWFWIQNSAHDGEPTIDIPYNILIPTHMTW